MPPEYEETSLWRVSLGGSAYPASEERYRERLRVAFETLRARTRVLVTRIASDLPQLTVHDITHLDALWETGSLIAGEGYPLNPMEGFVLGGAIVLHDAALCFEAYEGGLEGIRKTVKWRDALAAEKQNRFVCCSRFPRGDLGILSVPPSQHLQIPTGNRGLR